MGGRGVSSYIGTSNSADHYYRYRKSSAGIHLCVCARVRVLGGGWEEGVAAHDIGTSNSFDHIIGIIINGQESRCVRARMLGGACVGGWGRGGGCQLA